MLKPLLSMVALGAAIGLFWPSGHAPTPARGAKTVSTTASVPKETLLKRAPNGHFYTDVEVNGGDLVHVVVDTGATDVALTVDDARRIGIPFSESEFRPVGEGASGVIRGTTVTLQRVSLDGKDAREVRAVVLEGLPISLLGQSYLSKLGSVEMSGDYMRLD
jgi:aspartyl protease family protein